MRMSRPPLTQQHHIWLLAITAATAIMNVYYNQPLLADLAASFQVSSQTVSSIPTLTQLGFGIGVLLFVPLGDTLDRRRLIPTMLLCVTGALTAVAVSSSFLWLSIASFILGLLTVVPPIIAPFAAQIASPQERGKAVGTVMSGVFFGYLLSRTLSGFIGAHFGWRTVYWVAAALMFVLAIALSKRLPKSQPSTQAFYLELMGSLPTLLHEQSVLRESSLIGAMFFGVFNAFWSTLIFLLQLPPYHYGSEVAGLFGLVGIVGTIAAQVSGRLADKYIPRLTVGLAILVSMIAYGIFWQFGLQLWGLVLGVTLLDLGVQAGMVANQARIYTLLPSTYNSRLYTVYLVSYYLGGALGSTLGAYGWSVGQWHGVCAVSMGMLSIAFITYWVGFGRATSTQKAK